ncbi:MAG: 3'-5' exonuclease [Actinobacteria bacterium]|nr:3'-5' exonuclease [Actinomycetota bacterium]
MNSFAPARDGSPSSHAWVVLDTETTGLSPADSRIIEVAAATLDPLTFEAIDHRTWLLNPGGDTGPAHVHGITNEMVADCPSFADIAADLAAYLAGKILVAHNLRFDQGFLKEEFARADVDVDFGRGFCTYRNGVKTSLAKAREELNYPADGAHRALNDVFATIEVFKFITQTPDEQTSQRAAAAWSTLKPVRHTALDDDGIFSHPAEALGSRMRNMLGFLVPRRERSNDEVEAS